MSWYQSDEPVCGTEATCDPVDLVIVPKPKDIGAFEVRRSLPSARRRRVGPFVFLDQMGPAVIEPGAPIEVRPHPHIGIATVTWMIDGAIMHRDSLGYVQEIKPGELNWMVAGSGIVHSERTPEHLLETSHRVFGIQAWVALPQTHEETEASFVHYENAALPQIKDPDKVITLICGSAWNLTSPVEALHDTFYAQADLAPDVEITLPGTVQEKAILLLSGQISIAGKIFESGQLIVLKDNLEISIRAVELSQMMLLGGAPLGGDRHMWWNFVSSRPERIEQAKKDWRDGNFGEVPGDSDSIPLPD